MASAPSNASIDATHERPHRARAASRRPQPLIDALVPDAHLNAAVAGIRGLGLGGMRVMALGPSWTSPGPVVAAHGRPRRRPERGRGTRGARGADRAAGGRPWPAGRLSQPRGDDRPDAVRAPGGTASCCPFPGGEVLQQVRDKSRLEQNRRRGGAADARSPVRGHRRRSLRGTRFRWPVVVKPAQPVSALKTARLGERRGAARSGCWTAFPPTSRCWSRSGCGVRSCRSSW